MDVDGETVANHLPPVVDVWVPRSGTPTASSFSPASTLAMALDIIFASIKDDPYFAQKKSLMGPGGIEALRLVCKAVRRIVDSHVKYSLDLDCPDFSPFLSISARQFSRLNSLILKITKCSAPPTPYPTNFSKIPLKRIELNLIDMEETDQLMFLSPFLHSCDELKWLYIDSQDYQADEQLADMLLPIPFKNLESLYFHVDVKEEFYPKIFNRDWISFQVVLQPCRLQNG